jgi:Ser/Thr protein kinase RdoA (MazF antagonist)
MTDSITPYANLHPNLILDAIESIGLHCTGSLASLNSYENRVYQIGIEDAAPLIAKFYRPGRWDDATILEEHQFALELQEHEIPVIAPCIAENGKTLHTFEEFRFALFPRRGGRALELDSLDQLEWMGRFIGRLHAVGACKPFLHRPPIDIHTHGFYAYNFLIENNFIPAHLIKDYQTTVEIVLNKIAESFDRAGEIKSIRLHGDMHAGNVLWNDTGPHIVDLDDCVSGPAMQDIWMLLSGDDAEARLQLDFILEGYREFHDFNVRELHLIEALRSLRLLQYSAWLANRWQDPAFPRSFPWFNTPHYWEEQLGILNDQIHAFDNKFYVNYNY